ncbi:MAG: helix-turn-helix transcriptional regulator [Patescibacteria group bacterium]
MQDLTTLHTVVIKTLDKKILIFLGAKIRKERVARGLSQEKLGELAKLHRTYIGMIERAEKNITLMNLRKIADALGLETKNLIDF